MNITINHLPVPSWSWLKMNRAEVKGELNREARMVLTLPTGIDYSIEKNFSNKEIAGGMGEAYTSLLAGLGLPVHSFRLGAHQAVDKALILDFDFAQKPDAAALVELYVEEGAQMLVIMRYQNHKAQGTGAIQTKITLEKQAELHLVQVQACEGDFVFLNDFNAKQAEESDFKLSKVLLGGKESYEGFLVELLGDRSRFNTDLAYLVNESKKLDMNYIARHHGVKTESRINVKGVLRDKAYKMFRGTIDILRGAVNAKGGENEEVLLLDDDVHNKSIPLILCGEEDVEGAHGASIGKLDEDLLFYMQSRGIGEAEIYELMAKARIQEICEKIPHEPTRTALYAFLGVEQNA